MRYLVIAGCAALAACGGGDESFRASYKSRFVGTCVSSAQQVAANLGPAAAAASRNTNYTAVCGCVADKLIATKSVAELRTGPPQAEQLELARQCARENPPRVG